MYDDKTKKVANNIDCPNCKKDAFVTEDAQGAGIDCPSCGFQDYQLKEGVA